MNEINDNEITSSENFEDIKTLRSQNGGKKCPRIFSDAEYERRITNLRRHMEKEVTTTHSFSHRHSN